MKLSACNTFVFGFVLASMSEFTFAVLHVFCLHFVRQACVAVWCGVVCIFFFIIILFSISEFTFVIYVLYQLCVCIRARLT